MVEKQTTLTPEKSLKERLVDFLLDSPAELSEIYSKFKDETPTTIRGRLNENLEKHFRRLGRGVYIATKGKAHALIIEGDAWEFTKRLKDNSMDVIITDSGYSVLNKHYQIGSTRKRNLTKSIGFVTEDIDKSLLSDFFRVLKPGGHFFSFLPADALDTLDYNNRQVQIALEAGFTFNKRFIWDKLTIGMGYNGRNRYEQILFLSKGKRRMPRDRSIPDVLTRRKLPASRKIHYAEKPIELLVDLIKFSTDPGETIYDPFAGSFSTIEAALQEGRSAIGVDIDPRAIRKARERLVERNYPVKALEFKTRTNPKKVRRSSK